MMGPYGGQMGAVGWLAMGVVWLLLFVLIMWLVVKLLPGNTDGPTHDTGESALEILDRQLGSGEMDLPEWQARRNALMTTQPKEK